MECTVTLSNLLNYGLLEVVRFSPSDNSCDWLAVFLVENCGFGRPKDGGFKGGVGGGGRRKQKKKQRNKTNLDTCSHSCEQTGQAATTMYLKPQTVGSCTCKSVENQLYIKQSSLLSREKIAECLTKFTVFRRRTAAFMIVLTLCLYIYHGESACIHDNGHFVFRGRM